MLGDHTNKRKKLVYHLAYLPLNEKGINFSFIFRILNKLLIFESNPMKISKDLKAQGYNIFQNKTNNKSTDIQFQKVGLKKNMV